MMSRNIDGMQIEKSNRIREMYSTSNSQGSRISNGEHRTHFFQTINNYIDRLLETHVSEFPPASPKLNEIFDNSLNSHKPGNLQQSSDNNKCFESTHSDYHLQEEARDLSTHAELVAGSGVRINRHSLAQIMIMNRDYPAKIIRKLLKELITREEFPTMQEINHKKAFSISEKILQAMEVFICEKMDLKMDHEQFLKALTHQLKYIRMKHDINQTYGGMLTHFN